MNPDFARARLTEFERLREGAWPRWRRLYGSQIAYYRKVLGLEATPVRFRADNEAAWARVFDALGVVWKYEALEPDLSRAIRYQPDFWLVEQMTWVEIKSGPPTPGEIRVARDLLAATGRRVYILAGWPGRGRFGVWIFSEAGDAKTTRPDYCLIALCNLFDCGFRKLEEALGGKKQEK